MRRREKEITDKSKIIEIIGRSEVCRLGLSRGNVPYIVPMSFGYEYDGRLTLYFHCAAEGLKLDIIRENPIACFEMDCSRLIENESACSFSMAYESVIGTGRIAFIEDTSEKIRALRVIMRTYAPGREFDISEQAAARVVVFKLDAEELTGKASADFSR